jgi:hypothetical protein
LSLAFACDDEDFTGDSTLTPSAPTVSIAIPNNNVNMIEKDSTFEYTITLSQPQIVDVAVYVKKVSGDATLGSDFSIGSDVVIIPANRTTGTATVKVNADDLAEGTETFVIQIGDERTANASITPQTITYTVTNVSAGDLQLELGWDAKVSDTSGEPVPATDVADMIFYLTDLNGNVLKEIDGAAFESMVIAANYPDGQYLLKAGVYDVMALGDLGDAPALDIFIDYTQAGVIDPATIIFPQAMTATVCSSNVFTIASLTKTGTSYTLTEVGEFESVLFDFAGEYSANEPGYGLYPVEFTVSGGCNTITNSNFWDAHVAIRYVLDLGAGTVTIPQQSFVLGTTTYIVTGSGTFDAATAGMVVNYVVKTSAGATADSNTHTFVKQ